MSWNTIGMDCKPLEFNLKDAGLQDLAVAGFCERVEVNIDYSTSPPTVTDVMLLMGNILDEKAEEVGVENVWVSYTKVKPILSEGDEDFLEACNLS